MPGPVADTRAAVDEQGETGVTVGEGRVQRERLGRRAQQDDEGDQGDEKVYVEELERT